MAGANLQITIEYNGSEVIDVLHRLMAVTRTA